MISKNKWNAYVNKLSAIDKKAAELMTQWVEEHGLQDGNALIDYAYAVATKYGEAAATLACEMYDMNAALQSANVPPAEPAETATMEDVARSVNWAKYHSPSQVPSVVERLVKRAGADASIKNAIRDQAEWAWVPAGDSCAFCITLASRGWQVASKDVLKGNHAEHIHANCDCQFAIVFNETGKRMYDSVYDPEKYEEMYYGAEGSNWKERVNSMRRIRYRENKDFINAQKRDAYQARQVNNLAKRPSSFDNPEDVDFHYKKHKNEFGEEISKEEYVRRSEDIAKRPLSDTVEEVQRSDGSRSKYDKVTKEFVVINEDGTVRTYFIPELPDDYWREEHERNETN